MRALHRAAADVQWRADNLIDAQRLGAHRGADDVDHRVHRADFVKVNLLDVAVVNLGFGRAQRLEDRDRRLLRALADRRLADDLANFFQAAAMACACSCGAGTPAREPSCPDAVVVLAMLDMLVRMLVIMRHDRVHVLC